MEKYFHCCDNVVSIVDTSLTSVIEEYAKTKCQEWASILQSVQQLNAEYRTKMIEKQQQVLTEQMKEFDATLKEVKLKSQEKIAAA